MRSPRPEMPRSANRGSTYWSPVKAPIASLQNRLQAPALQMRLAARYCYCPQFTGSHAFFDISLPSKKGNYY
ncbi:hypothetical protein CEXT_50201 [Caerostris extrusa]|uniref:Uncharacterized protein n=1 Tax=Caerostris extrusa TaxID=172846 RepID=A0AAV4SH85_CAEEX|nr:hypothetical protein CEXT_50201 [Caerostris extrusa]